jgi:hypothetical protein
LTHECVVGLLPTGKSYLPVGNLGIIADSTHFTKNLTIQDTNLDG